MSGFRVFIKKEFLHIVRDKRTLLIIVLLPVIEILLFGYVLSFEISNVQLGIVDQAHSTASRAVIRAIDASDYFTLHPLRSSQQIETLMDQNRIKAALCFAPDFGQPSATTASLQIVLDAGDPNMARTIETYLSSIITSQNSAPRSVVTLKPLLFYNPLQKTVFTSIPGLMAVVLMLICALMTSISLTREKESGTLRVLLISPLHPYHIIAGKLIPYLAVSVFNILLILGLSTAIFGVPIRGSLLLLFVISLIYCLCALALGLFISTRAATQQVAMLASQAGLMLPTTLLSGMIYPIKNMPQWLQGVTALFPARWYVEILKHIMIKGSPIIDFAPQMAILVGMTLFLMIISVRSFSLRID